MPDYLDFDYSTYENNKLPVKFFDSEFGEFWGNMSHAMNGQSNHPDRLKLKFRKALDEHYSSIEGNYDLPEGITLKEGQTLPQNKQTERRIFIDEKFGEFESTFLALQYRGASLHPMVTHERKSSVEFKMIQTDNAKKMWQKFKKEGYIHASSSPEAVQKRKKTCLKRYGTEYPAMNPDVREKAKKTLIEKYSLDSPEKVSQFYKEKLNKSVMNKYGVENISQIPSVRLKAAKSARKIIEVTHWKTGEKVPCYGTWEQKVAEYFNDNEINYEKEKRTFKLADLNQTYTPDFYLPDLDLWVEVKGRVYDAWQKKWNSFQKLGLNAEVWDKKVLLSKGIKVR
ncbi:MAG TPA: hypothetical protein PKI14_05000 [Fervidobacterium sp.]|nr:hypothetical protein [Fervidobacterium sp.]